jgi:hypothetical protein
LLRLLQSRILKGILNARLPARDSNRNANQPGDVSLATAIKKQKSGRRMKASRRKARAKRFV